MEKRKVLFSINNGEHGALGITNLESQWIPVKVQFFEQGKTSIKSISCGAKHTSMIDKDGNLYVCGTGEFGQLGTNSKNKQILPFRLPNNYGPIYSSSCGTSHTLILTETGEVFSTGGNDFGQLGNGTDRKSVV